MADASIAHGTFFTSDRFALFYCEIVHRTVFTAKTTAHTGIADLKLLGIMRCLAIESVSLSKQSAQMTYEADPFRGIFSHTNVCCHPFDFLIRSSDDLTILLFCFLECLGIADGIRHLDM